VYFRGRRLLGRNVPVPQGHVGAVLKITSDKVQKPPAEENEEEDDEVVEETFVTEEVATFDSIMVWNHETVPEASEDPYVKGMEEWMGMAEAVSCSYSSAW
jgi:ribonuclease H2 subunit C